MFVRRLYLSLLALMLFAAGGRASADTTVIFNGGGVAGCSVAGAVYTCASLPLGSKDNMVIASGFRVNVTSSVIFANNQGLAMSGSAILASSGNLDITGIKPGDLAVTGGTLIAQNTFTADAQTLTADIQARDADLGRGAGLVLTGNITVTGTVSLAPHTTVNGNITAKVSLEMDSHAVVTGNVDAGTLTMHPAEAIINGNATVNSAVLGAQDRITQTIYCKGGTRPGQCDCVENNSHYDVNTAEGPHCQGNQVPLDHIMIGYDPNGSVCASSNVTVTACANAACTSTYGGGVSLTLTPVGQTVNIGSDGVRQVSVNYTQAGINTLGVSGVSTAGATTCIVNGASAAGANCQVNVARSAYAMSLGTATGYTAESAQTLTVAALRYDDTSKSCVTLFNGTTRNANFTCTYGNPTSGYVPVRLNGIALNAAQQASAACDSTGATVPLTFDANGKATLPLKYADAGQVSVTITDNGSGSPGTANVTTTFVPARFDVALVLGTPPLRAGQDFTVKVTAQNAAGAATPNFGRETAPEKPRLGAIPCLPTTSTALLSQDSNPALGAGVYTFSNVEWSDVGSIDLQATLASNSYLGTGMVPAPGTTNTDTSGCTGLAGRFIPAYFTVEPDTGWQRKATLGGAQWSQYYSGEPAIRLKVTARTVQNGVPQSYAGKLARDVAFGALNPTGGALGATGAGTFSPAYPVSGSTASAQVRADDFTAGTATWTGSYTFTTSPTVQTRLRVRATEVGQGIAYPVSSSAIPAGGTVPAEPTLLVRSGRIRVSNAFGGIGKLTLPVALEYYTGQTWVRNSEDTTTQIGVGKSAVSTGTALDVDTALTAFTNGAATLSLTPSKAQRGSIPVAINLGTDSVNTSCYYNTTTGNMKPSVGAALPFLRSTDASCGRTGADPSALATFGVYAPEIKRVIHQREVYQ
jgi:MSHA biogenesis protein MshQ